MINTNQKVSRILEPAKEIRTGSIVTTNHELSLEDHKILQFESQPWSNRVEKLEAIREVLGITPIHYFLRLHKLSYDVKALQFDPQLIGRLHRLRYSRETKRAVRTGIPLKNAEVR